MRNRSERRPNRYDKGNVESTMILPGTSKQTFILEKTKLQFRQNSLFRNNKFLAELPKVFPIQKKMFNLKPKHIELLIMADKRLQLRGVKLSQDTNDMLEESTIDTNEFDKQYSPNLKKKDQNSNSSSYLPNIFTKLVFRMNGVRHMLPAKGIKIKAYIEEGNNSRLIKELMRKRPGIKIVDRKEEADLIWTRFADYEATDRVSSYQEISTDKLPTSLYTSDQLIEAYRRFTYFSLESDEKEILNGRKAIEIGKLCLHNHLKNHEELSDKKNLFKNIRNYCQLNKISEESIIPKTYHLDYHILQPEEMNKKIDEIFDNKHANYNEESCFVVKPGEDTNRGKGITVVKGKKSVLAAIKELEKIGKSSLIQEYIDPLLYKNRKFDIRCFVLITNVAGKLKAYWYKEGYLRTCCKEFNYDPSNIYGHLTNDAVQKKCKDYGKYENANKLSYSELETILAQQTERTKKEVISEMKQLAIHSIRSTEDKISAGTNIFSFEILGYDFLIDKAGKVWLIEINTNPCLEFSGSLLSRILWHMVDNSFKIAIDPFLEVDPRREFENYLDLNKYESII